MTPPRATLTTLLASLTALVVPQLAFAHEGEHRVDLHEGFEYDSCYFDLHPELTDEEFKQFAAEAGQIVYFRQVASAETLGQWNFDASLGGNYSLIDDTKGAWNNTMTHPGDDHYLGEALLIPQLTLRVGVTDDVDVELYVSGNPSSNYFFVGAATKIRLLDEHDGLPVSLSVRPNVAGLLGAEEVQVWTFGTDVSVSRNFGGLAPFAGIGLNSNLAVDNSDDTDVGNQVALRAVPFAGLDYTWGMLSTGAQAELASVPIISARLGARF